MGGETRTHCLLTIEGMFSASEPEMQTEPMKPRFTVNLKNNVVMEGSRARLDCVAVAHPEPEVIQVKSLLCSLWLPSYFWKVSVS